MPKFYTLLLFLICTFFKGFALSASLTEAQIFEWWDSGIVSPEEAQEMLDLVQEGNEREACFLAEIYALETCEIQKAPKEKTPTKKKTKGTGETAANGSGKNRAGSAAKVRGRFFWKAQVDSLGELSKKNYNLQLEFYRFSLRLGTQELLSYKNKGAEAYFGQVSTKELRSHIPLDTLWGTALFYPLGNFTLGALLDTAKNAAAHLEYAFGKAVSISAAYWHSTSQQSIALHGKSSRGEISLWQRFGQTSSGQNLFQQPLIKVQLHNDEKRVGQTFSWRTTAYYHGDSLPKQARLSKTLQKYRFWGSQSLSFAFADLANTKISASTRVAMPLDADTASAKIKLQGDSGPRYLRVSASATCQDAENSCTTSDYRLQATWRALENLTFENPALESAGSTDRGNITAQGSIKAEYKRGDGFHRPKLELGTAYSQGDLNRFSLSLILPKANFAEKIQIRNQVDMGTEKLQTSLGVTLSRSRGEHIKPLRGYMQIRGNF